jgi:phosphatidylserine decarboxylase
LGSFFFLIVIFSLYFFRDPERICPGGEGIVFSPADGIITSISQVNLPDKFLIEDLNKEAKFIKISIFLNVFDVHVNRSPIQGNIKKIIYSPGKFINVAKEKESEDNENNTLIIQDEKRGNFLIVTQIAGLIARRIVCDKKTFEDIEPGERFGIIKFGSRVNLYVPAHFKILVQKGQRMLGGETIIAAEYFEDLEKLDYKK